MLNVHNVIENTFFSNSAAFIDFDKLIEPVMKDLLRSTLQVPSHHISVKPAGMVEGGGS